MCYDDRARPPLPPISGGAADTGDIFLTASDGTQNAAHFARASKPGGAGMIVLPDVRGLHHFFKELADRFADAGVDAVAIDYFTRTAGSGDRSDSFEYMPHLPQSTPEVVALDVAAAYAYLTSSEGGAVKSVFTVGFCFGGSNSWAQSALNPELSGCIGFYGRPMRAESYISKMKVPLQIMVAGSDGATTPEQSVEFERELTRAGVPHEEHIYAGAPHSFFDRTYEQWKEACDDAWRRMLHFIEEHN
jgi:carboxymethylenebutenolidase